MGYGEQYNKIENLLWCTIECLFNVVIENWHCGGEGSRQVNVRQVLAKFVRLLATRRRRRRGAQCKCSPWRFTHVARPHCNCLWFFQLTPAAAPLLRVTPAYKIDDRSRPPTSPESIVNDTHPHVAMLPCAAAQQSVRAALRISNQTSISTCVLA